MARITMAAISSGRTDARMPPNAPIGVRIASMMTASIMSLSKDHSWADSTIYKTRSLRTTGRTCVDSSSELMYSMNNNSVRLGVTKMATKKIKINRAPVLTLWAAIVAERLGYDEQEA